MVRVTPVRVEPAADESGGDIVFGRFTLAVGAGRLLRDGRELPLRPKAFDLLRVLAARPGTLVTKDELLDTVWGTHHISEGVIKTTVAELRAALGEDPKHPIWIETVPRRGYRFAVHGGSSLVDAQALPAVGAAEGEALVGRERATEALRRCWRNAMQGQMGLVLVAGDAGVGKSALVRAFAGAVDGAQVARGQCVESFGQGEPYLPWLEALSSLADGAPDLAGLMLRCAPSWYAHLPWLHSAEDRQALGVAGVVQAERMPREMAALLSQLAARAPLLLVLEDLHWSDDASTRLLDHLARRRGSARVLVVVTFRASDLPQGGHPLADVRREWLLHGLAHELALEGLDLPALRRLLERWCPGADWPHEVEQALHDHTAGMPLFVRAVLDTLVAQGVLVSLDPGRWRLQGRLPRPLPLPETVAGLFEKQLAALTAMQREVLEVASVVGIAFDAPTVAHVLGLPPADIHARCDGLVQGGRWLREDGLVPTAGGLGGRYRFGHALMRQQCYARSGGARRIQLHRRVAQALLEVHHDRADELIAPLAWHHEQAHDVDAALALLRRGADVASSRQAPHDLLALADRALALLGWDKAPAGGGAAPPSPSPQVFEFAVRRAAALGLISGHANPAFAQAVQRALDSAAGRPLDEGLLNLHRMRWLHHIARGRLDLALVVAEQMAGATETKVSPGCRVQALSMLSFTSFKCGAFARARSAIAEADAWAPRVEPPSLPYARFFEQQAHERVLLAAMIATLLGEPTGPVGPVRAMPAACYTPMSRVLNGVLCGLWLAWRGDAAAVADDAREALDLIDREELTSGAVPHRLLLAWARGAADGADATGAAWADLCEALQQVLAGDQRTDHAAFLERACDLALRAGHLGDAEAHLKAAFAHVAGSGERYVLPLLWLRKADLAVAKGEFEAAAEARHTAACVRAAMSAPSPASSTLGLPEPA